jgi:hypothetical protein
VLRSVDGVRRLRSRLQLLEDLSEALGGIRCCGEVLVVHGGLEFLERAVDAGGVGAVQRVKDPVPYVVEGEEIPVDRGRVACRRVYGEPGGPEVEAGAVDLGRRPVAQLEVEAPLRGVDRRLPRTRSPTRRWHSIQ